MSRTSRLKRVAVAAAAAIGLTAAIAAEPALDVAEEAGVERLPTPSPHWVFVSDPSPLALSAGKIYLFDASSRRMLGMMSVGYYANLVLAGSRDRYYAVETFYARGTRGSRADVVTLYDRASFQPVAEIPLTQGRVLTPQKKNAAALTSDDRFLLSFNMKPAQSVSVVDLQSRAHVQEIQTPGCALVFPYAPRRFASLCGNGSMMTVALGEDGTGRVMRGKPFFDPINDPVYDHAIFSEPRRRAYLLSYSGRIFEFDLAGETPVRRADWSVATRDDAAAGWRPGGWQLLAYHRTSDRLFVLMHVGGEWTHKDPATEAWVFDGTTRKRVARIRLHEPAISIAVTQDDKPRLVASSGTALAVYDASDAAYPYLGGIKEAGQYPLMLSVFGE